MVSIKLEHRAAGGGADAWIDAIQGPRDAMEAVSEIVESDVGERFRTETDPWGGAWAPLSPATLDLYRRRGKRASRDRLTNSRFSRVVDGGRRAVVGLRSKVSRWFHEGNPSARIFGKSPAPRPARPILPIRDGSHDIPPALREDVMRAFREGIRRAVRKVR